MARPVISAPRRPAASDVPAGRETLLDLSAVGVDPARFQPRDVPAGMETDPQKVREITSAYRPEEFDAILVVRDPARPGQYITVAGHHRRAAALELDAAGQFATPGQIPARIIDADVSTPAGLQKAQDIATRTNTTVAGLTPREYIQRIRTLRHERGANKRTIANELRTLREPNLSNYIWLSNLPDDAVDRALLYPDTFHVGVEAGRAMDVHGLTSGQAADFVNRYVNMLGETGNKPPAQMKLRSAIDKAFSEDKELVRGQQGALADASENFSDAKLTNKAWESVIGLLATDTDIERQSKQLRTRMTACERVAEEMGIDVSQLRSQVDERIRQNRIVQVATLEKAQQQIRGETAEFEASVPVAPAAAAPPPPQPEPEPPPQPAGGMSWDMFSGEMVQDTRPVEDAVPEPETAPAAAAAPEQAAADALMTPPPPVEMVAATENAIERASDNGIVSQKEMELIVPSLPDNATPQECSLAARQAVQAGIAAERVAESAAADKAAALEELKELAAQTGLPTRVQLPAGANTLKMTADGNDLTAYRRAIPKPTNFAERFDRDEESTYSAPPPAASAPAQTPDMFDVSASGGAGFGLAQQTERQEQIAVTMRPVSASWYSMSEPQRLDALDRYNALMARVDAANRAIDGAAAVIDRAAVVAQNARDCRMAATANRPIAPAPISIVSRTAVAERVAALPRRDRNRTAAIARDIEKSSRARRGRRHSDPFARRGDIPRWATRRR